MPELPEVETTRRGLAPHVERQKVTAVRIYDRRLRWPVPAGLGKVLVGKTIDRIARRSKYLLFHTTAGTLIIHLGMTGSLRIYQRAPARRLHDHVDIAFGNGALMRYHDPGALVRCSGPLRTCPIRCSPRSVRAARTWFHRRALHAALYALRPHQAGADEQRRRRGVGNIYASEALPAGIRPTRQANRLSRASCERLVSAVRDTLGDALGRGGSTLRDYVDSNGEPGESQLHHFVYGRAGKPCRVCGATIRAVRQAGRATTYCPTCQR
jgi:formamidopyrimidine-DNA glycosylase